MSNYHFLSQRLFSFLRYAALEIYRVEELQKSKKNQIADKKKNLTVNWSTKTDLLSKLILL